MVLSSNKFRGIVQLLFQEKKIDNFKIYIREKSTCCETLVFDESEDNSIFVWEKGITNEAKAQS